MVLNYMVEVQSTKGKIRKKEIFIEHELGVYWPWLPGTLQVL